VAVIHCEMLRSLRSSAHPTPQGPPNAVVGRRPIGWSEAARTERSGREQWNDGTNAGRSLDFAPS
jgi:hypothetical protein